MIISFEHKFIFLKTRKTGGSSIQMALTPICGPDDIIIGNDSNFLGINFERNVDRAFTFNGHANLRQLKFALPEQVWNSFFKFTFVRNPWDLAVSRYHWEKKGVNCSIENFRSWLARYVDNELAQPEYNEQSNILQRIWNIGGSYIDDLQSKFVMDGKKIDVDFIGRYENIQHDFDSVCKILKIETPTLPLLKVGFRKISNYRDAYDDVSRRGIARAFATDIEVFGYEF